MEKIEQIKKLKSLFEKILKQFPELVGENGDYVSRVVEIKNTHLKKNINLIEIHYGISPGLGVKYDHFHIGFPVKGIEGQLMFRPNRLNESISDELDLFISLFKSVLEGKEIIEHKTFYLDGESSYYEVTSRLRTGVDLWELSKPFVFLNEYYDDKCDGPCILPDKYLSSEQILYDDILHLSIHKEVSLLDIKSVILIMCSDVHITVQSLDYICFQGVRDRYSQQPSSERIERWKKIIQ